MQLFDYVNRWDHLLYFAYNNTAYLKYLSLSKDIKALLKKNRDLKQTHKGERCFIVLNGPSIKNYNLSLLEREYVICCNQFYKSALVSIVKPNLFCWQDSKELVTDEGQKIINDIKTKFSDALLLFNIKAYRKERKDNDNLFYTYNKHLPYYGHIRNDLDKLCSGFKTVAFYAINAAIYMGFSDIYIVGLDFEPTGFKHYNDIPGAMKELNTINDDHKICDHFWAYSQQHLEAYAIAKYAKDNCVRIVNVNDQSYIRAFQFGKYEDIF